jgi:hypothetical protein
MGAFTKIFQRLKLTADTNVSTQTTTVIAADTTNSSLVIAPNGTGALIANIPDGLTAGGNARGLWAVDLQLSRGFNNEVASGQYSFAAGLGNTANGFGAIAMGQRNTASALGSTAIGGGGGAGGGVNALGQFATAIGGYQNNASGTYSGILSGTVNTVSSNYGVVVGGQGNTASTNGHATVVGGQSNTASGSHSIVVGGQGNTASGTQSLSGGNLNTASGVQSIALGSGQVANNAQSVCIGLGPSLASGQASVVLGYGNHATEFGSMALCNSSISYLTSQVSIASGTFSGFPGERGEAQQSLLTARRLASLNSGATAVLSLNGTGVTNLLIPYGTNRVWAAKITATAFVSIAGGTLVLGDSYMGEYTLLFKKVGGVSSVVGVNAGNIIYDTNMVTAAFTFAAGASQDLQITFKAPTTASATTFRCVARVELTEVAY